MRLWSCTIVKGDDTQKVNVARDSVVSHLTTCVVSTVNLLKFGTA